jgi:protein O-GlcNAc transferase
MTRHDSAAAVAAVEEAHKLRLLALEHSESGDDDRALEMLRSALRVAPNNALIHSDIGVIATRQERWRFAAQCFARAVKLDPSDSVSRFYWATALRQCDALRAAWREYKILLEGRPADFDALEGLVDTANLLCDSEAALPFLERAATVKPRSRRIHRWIAKIHNRHGRMNECLDALRREGRLTPAAMESARLYASLGWPEATAESQKSAFERWITLYTKLAGALPVRTKNRRSTHPLRIGYLTGEFTNVPAYYFVMPLVQFHNPERTQLVLYHSREEMDACTAEARRYFQMFHQVSQWTNDRIAEQIQEDQIDVLVDLSGHFDDHRLPVFRQRPAPVSFTYPNYPGTTGVPEIDFIFTDRWVDPAGSPAKYVEKPWHLDCGYLAYYPPRDAPPVAPPPALQNGYITFGLVQKPLKLHAGVWDSAAAVLRTVRHSRLILQYGFDDLNNPNSTACRRIRAEFAERGVDPRRVSFRGPMSRQEHMMLRHEFDIGLDTFPYNGQTTTCESLWMGVPTITLAGETHVSRVGCTLLSNAGLTDYVANTHDEYVELAARHAQDLRRLATLRTSLRANVRRRLNGRRLARTVEDAYLRASAGR